MSEEQNLLIRTGNLLMHRIVTVKKGDMEMKGRINSFGYDRQGNISIDVEEYEPSEAVQR